MNQTNLLSFIKKRTSNDLDKADLDSDNDLNQNIQSSNKKSCKTADVDFNYIKNNHQLIFYPNESKLREYFGNQWFEILKYELSKPYFIECLKKVHNQRQISPVYPPENQMFHCFRITPIDRISVVIIGQDPYHQPGQAMGLSFSVPKNVTIPPSLRNIYKEIGRNNPTHGDLTSWAKQGVFLLNSLLSVEESKPMSHKDYGWDKFTNAVISIINKLERPIVFMLWGRSAQLKAANVCKKKHLVLESGHPSPLSQKKFIGCDHFKKCNEFLKKINRPEIKWIPDDFR